MPESRTANPDFNRAFGDAKKQAGNVAGEVQDAAADLYGQARDSAAQVADAATTAARNTAGSFEQALRNTVETQPYTAVVIALGIGWLLGRMHRPLENSAQPAAPPSGRPKRRWRAGGEADRTGEGTQGCPC